MIANNPPLTFTTARLTIQNWAADIALGPTFANALGQILSQKVLAPLPPALQIEGGKVSQWITARDQDSAVSAIN